MRTGEALDSLLRYTRCFCDGPGHVLEAPCNWRPEVAAVITAFARLNGRLNQLDERYPGMGPTLKTSEIRALLTGGDE